MKAHQVQRKKRWKVVKDIDHKYSDREWEDMKVMVEKEVVKQMVVVVEEVVVERQRRTKAKPSQENQQTHERNECQRKTVDRLCR
jgi:hypothetical protein